MNERYIVAGGDMRFLALAEELSAENEVWVCGFDRETIKKGSEIRYSEKISDIDCDTPCLILPLPVSANGTDISTPLYHGEISIESLIPLAKKSGIVFGGRFSENVRSIFENEGITVIDYFEREELAVLNALATAEGAVQIALSEQPVTLSGEKVLITGMGRIAKSLIRILSGFGTEITVAARKHSDLAWAEVLGCKTVRISELEHSEAIKNTDIIFNTVPACIFTKDVLKNIRSGCLITDLASKPGGVDTDAAGKLGLKVIWALSLPGKTAPVSSGKIIASTIKNILADMRTGRL